MTRDYTYATKYQLCPHCGRDSGCKIFDDGKVWCLRISSKLDVAPGYRLIGWLGNGMGASVIPDDKEENWQQKQERIEYENRRRQWERQKSQNLNELLDIEERNTQYRRIAKRLDLSRQHRSQLRTRGLSDREIDFAFERGWLRTWQSGEPTICANPLLAGINPLTLKLTGVDGFSIAACDPKEAIAGHQIAPDNRTKLGKYIWLSSKSYGGNGPQLPNKELPLFVWRHPQALKTEDIYLIEGALKSLLVALFLWRQGNYNIVVIGTAAAARYGKKTLQEYLLQLEAKRIVLLPDAGAVANPHINKANQQTLDWLPKWGYHTRVADWGQFHDKSQPDFDELLAADRDCEIKFISSSEYLAETSERLDIFAGFTRWLENVFKRYKPKKGFGQKSPSRKIEPASIIRYKPGKLPKYSEYCDRHPPRIIYLVAGSLSLNYGKLSIAIHNPRHGNIAKAAKWNIYLDSTTNSKYLALWLDIKEKEILHLEQEKPNYKNLEIIRVRGLGLAGKERSELCDRRISALIAHLRQEIPDLVIEDWKDKLPIGEPLHDEKGKAKYLAKFRDTRGANYALNAPAIASFGIPYPNIGFLENQYRVLAGHTIDETEFHAFVDWIVQGEIIQTIGRLRSHLRPNQQLKFYFCADYDLSFLKDEGFRVTEIEAFQITPEAGDPTQISRWVILKGYQAAIEAGNNPETIKLKEIATHAHLSTSRVGQVAAAFGGIKVLRKILAALIYPYKEELKKTESLDRDILWLARTYLPLALEQPLSESVREIIHIARTMSWHEFRKIMGQVVPEVKAQILGMMLTLLPKKVAVQLTNGGFRSSHQKS